MTTPANPAAHTPLPWAACKGGGCRCGQIWSVPADQQVAHANDEWGDEPGFPYGAVGRVQQAANAALIVRAVNNHDDLLALAHQYASDLRHPPIADSVERRLERIAAVLAKVGDV